MNEVVVADNHWICPSCGEQLHPVNGDKSTHFGCPNCGTFFVDAWDEPKRIIRQYKDWGSLTPTIPLGAKGLLNRVEYTVVGMMQKVEKDNVYECWNEYLLYSSDDRSAILVEYNGHWMLVKSLTEVLQAEAVGGDYIVNYQGEIYRLYHSYDFLVRNAVGEFDWNILEDEGQPIFEYTVGSKLVTQELIKEVPCWYAGNYVDAADIATAFGILRENLPYQSGTHVLQDNPYEKYRNPLIKVAMIMTFIAGTVQLIFCQLYPSSTLLNEHYTTEKDSATASTLRPIISPSFHLQYRSAIHVDLDAGIDNDWLEVNATLVNETTGRDYETSKSIEYYRGYEEGESWSEGSTSKEAVFSSVPPGNYHLNLLPTSEGAKEVILNVKVTHSNWIMSNFIIMMLAIISAPVINQLLYANFEKKRNPS